MSRLRILVWAAVFSVPSSAHAWEYFPDVEGDGWFEVIGLNRADPLVQSVLDDSETGVELGYGLDGTVLSVRLHHASTRHGTYDRVLPGGADWESLLETFEFRGRRRARSASHERYRLTLFSDRKVPTVLWIKHVDHMHSKPATNAAVEEEPEPVVVPQPPSSPLAQLRDAMVMVAEGEGYTVAASRTVNLRTDGDRVRTELRYPQKADGKYAVLLLGSADGTGDIEFGQRGEHGYLQALEVKTELHADGRFVAARSLIHAAQDGDHTIEFTFKYSSLMGNPDTTILKLVVLEYLR